MFARSRIGFSLIALMAILAGCSGSSNFLGSTNLPQGNITVSSYPGGMQLKTSATAPYQIADTFSVAIAETNFGGPYTVQMYSWDNGFNEPCFVPHSVSDTIYTFAPDHAAAATAPAGTPNPCKAGDVETALITDGKGHDAYFAFELTAALTGGSVATPTPAASGSTGQTACSQGDPNYASLTLIGSVQQFDFPQCNSITILATMPANGSDGDGVEVGTSASTTFSNSTTAANGTPVLSLALSPSPNAITFTNTTQSLAVQISGGFVNSGGTYTMELRENNQVIETITQIQANDGELFVNIHPLNGTFDLATYVAIIYRN